MIGGSKFILGLMAAGLLALSACAHTPSVKPYGPGPGDPRAERIVIEKSLGRMTLYKDGRAWREYRIALGSGGLAPKMQEGDHLTPEGVYFIKNRNPQSIYHRSLRISYPNESDARRAKLMGVQPGGHIMIHGLSADKRRLGKRHAQTNWTQGCIAVTDREIEEIWNSVADGTPVEIRA